MSPYMATINVPGKAIPAVPLQPLPKEDMAKLAELFPSFDRYKSLASNYRKACTNIYKTKDKRFFNLHGMECYPQNLPCCY